LLRLLLVLSQSVIFSNKDMKMKSLAARRAVAKENDMEYAVMFGAILGVIVGAAVVYFNIGLI
jgi:hypothetical protein